MGIFDGDAPYGLMYGASLLDCRFLLGIFDGDAPYGYFLLPSSLELLQKYNAPHPNPPREF
ncbi:hypothetical protein QT971_30980, partial [Microcoleus sp. herbarium19]